MKILGDAPRTQTRSIKQPKSASMLEALNPMAILERGYSITRKLPEQTIVRSTRQVRIDQNLEILLAKGKISVTVNEKHVKTQKMPSSQTATEQKDE